MGGHPVKERGRVVNWVKGSWHPADLKRDVHCRINKNRVLLFAPLPPAPRYSGFKRVGVHVGEGY